MNPSKVKCVSEDEKAFVMNDGKSDFRVPKSGLSAALHEKIRAMAPPVKMAAGGDVFAFPQRLGPDAGVAAYLPGDAPNRSIGQPAPVLDYSAIDAFDAAHNAAAIPSGAGGGVGSDMAVFDTTRNAAIPDMGEGGAGMSHAPTPVYANAKAAEHKAASEALGIRKEGEVAPEKSAASDPMLEARKADNARKLGIRHGSANAGPDEYAGVTKAGEEAAAAKYSAEAQQAKNAAAAEAERVKVLQAAQLDQKTAADRAAQESAAMMSQIQDANNEMKRIDTTVDPGRFWASRSTGQKIAGIIGLALGAIGTGPDGVNRAAGLLNQAIDRDIDAQKAEHDLRLKKGQQSVASATSMYGMHRQRLQDDIAARTAAKATGDEIAASKAMEMAAATADPVLKANLMQTHAKLLADASANHAQTQQRLDERNYKQGMLGLEAQKVELERARAGGAGPKAIDQKQIDTLIETEGLHKVVQDRGAKLKALIDAYGTSELLGPQRAQMDQLVSDIATAQAKMNDPLTGARPGEVEIESRNIFEPGFLQLSGSAKQKLDSYLANSKQKRNTRYEVLGLTPPGAK